MKDFIQSALAVNQWWLLAWFDIKQAYRRSVLGPFWITLSNAFMIVTLSILWSQVFDIRLFDMLPFFAVGSLLWTLINVQIKESCVGFIEFDGYIRQLSLPLPVYILRIWARNIINFLHNIIILVGVFIFFGCGWQPFIFEAAMGIMLILFSVFFLSMIMAYLCTRFRDVALIIENGLQIAFFLTPIIWKPNMLPHDKLWFTQLNPLYHFIEIVRAPLLGESASINSWIWVCSSLAILVVMGVSVHVACRKKLAYWL